VSALEPGFYTATVEGVPDILIMITDDGGSGWTTRKVPDTPYGTYGHGPADFTDARPLIVLDLSDRHRREYVLEILRAARHGWTHDVADQIEAQTKPARIPEPGLWGVVEASSVTYSGRRNYVRDTSLDPGSNWRASTGKCPWANLIDPTLIREGVTS